MTRPEHYRPDIDGLRAIAIGGVLLFHVNEHWMPGGFVGVDVFFVISGYLITGILCRDLAKGSFSLGRFYERRIRRIVPALLAMFVAVAACGWVFMLPDDFSEMMRSMRYAALSFSNLHFLKSGEGYFSPEDFEMPLLHTWSLSVEEQFYLVFPVLMLACRRWCKSAGGLFGWMAGLGLLSLAGSQWVVAEHASKAFFLLPWRAWELLLGGCLALAPLPRPGRKVAEAAGWCGLGMILAPMMWYAPTTVFPGLSALPPCAGAALLLYAGLNRESLVSRVMGWRPLVGLGLISYSVYLWHWPLVAFTGYFYGDSHPFGPAIIAGSLLLGWLSWKFIETPFRVGFGLPRRKVFLGWAVSMAAICLAAMVVRQRDGFPGRFDESVLSMAGQGRPEVKLGARWEQDGVESTGELKPVVALWGDSHAEALLGAMDGLSEKMGLNMISLVEGAHPPFPGWEPDQPVERLREKRNLADRNFVFLKNHPSVRVAIIGARWWVYLGQLERGDRMEVERIYQLMENVIRDFRKSGKRVVLVYPVPELPFDVPKHAAKLMAWSVPVPEYLPESPASRQWNPLAEAMLDRLAKIDGVTVVKPRDEMIRDGKVRVMEGNTAFYRDDDHLSSAGSMILSDDLEEAIREALGKK